MSSPKAVIYRLEPTFIARMLRRLERTAGAKAILISEDDAQLPRNAGNFQVRKITLSLQGLAVVPPIIVDPAFATWALCCANGERCTILKVERANSDGVLEFTVLDKSPRLTRVVLVFNGQTFEWPIIVPSTPSAR